MLGRPRFSGLRGRMPKEVSPLLCPACDCEVEVVLGAPLIMVAGGHDLGSRKIFAWPCSCPLTEEQGESLRSQLDFLLLCYNRQLSLDKPGLCPRQSDHSMVGEFMEDES